MKSYESCSAFFVDLLFPRRCPVCGEVVLPRGQLICAPCMKKLSFVKQPLCKKCGKEVITMETELCLDCSRHKRSFQYGRALINYDERARYSMAQIKYKNKREYLDFYGEAICARYEGVIRRMEADALVPVPVHPSRMKERGFNQAQVLAERIGEGMKIPVCTTLLTRNKKTLPQKQLNPMERLKNLEEAFVPGRKTDQVNSVILVDDIYTTGSTIEACARALLKAGMKRVYFLTICIGQGQ